jgi:hypothetical protein
MLAALAIQLIYSYMGMFVNEQQRCLWRVRRLHLCLVSISPPLGRLATKPCSLDGCPMFADFRVHGLNRTFFECFQHRSTNYLQEIRGSAQTQEALIENHPVFRCKFATSASGDKAFFT